MKKGFFDSLLTEVDGPRAGAVGGLVVEDSEGVRVTGGNGSDTDGLLSLERTWLLVGVVS